MTGSPTPMVLAFVLATVVFIGASTDATRDFTYGFLILILLGLLLWNYGNVHSFISKSLSPA